MTSSRAGLFNRQLRYRVVGKSLPIFESDYRIIIISFRRHVALLFGKKPVSNNSRHIGSIDPQCDVMDVVQDAYENARFLCDQYYLSSPELIVKQNIPEDDSKIRIVYVPSHLYHILFELFKNSMRAVMEANSVSEQYPPIEVTLVKGREDICVKISDRGGGIPRSQTDQLFNYMFSTAPQPPKSDAHTVPLAGYGYGLPISRLYARYFHGELALMSCEGFGTDCIVYLKALSNEANELLPIFNKASSRYYRTPVQTGDWSNSGTSMGVRPSGAMKPRRHTLSTPSPTISQHAHC